MSLTVETGAGISTAESYISVLDFRAWAASRGYSTVEDKDDEDLEPKLRLATEYIDAMFEFKGSRLSAAQALEFPRADLTDSGGLAVTGLPRRVKDACAELTYQALAQPLTTNMARGGRVTSRSVGPISVTYAEDAPTGTVWTVAHNLLKPYEKRGARIGKPGSVGVPAAGAAGYFEMGAMSNPPDTDATVSDQP
jgi:hypothetical protein